jgi:hypothetical protein
VKRIYRRRCVPLHAVCGETQQKNGVETERWPGNPHSSQQIQRLTPIPSYAEGIVAIHIGSDAVCYKRRRGDRPFNSPTAKYIYCKSIRTASIDLTATLSGTTESQSNRKRSANVIARGCHLQGFH